MPAPYIELLEVLDERGLALQQQLTHACELRSNGEVQLPAPRTLHRGLHYRVRGTYQRCELPQQIGLHADILDLAEIGLKRF